MAFKVTYQVTRAEFESARQNCAANGIMIVGDSQMDPDDPVVYHGAKFNFNYVEPNLEVDVFHVPWPATDSYVRGKLNAEFLGHS